MKTEFVATPRNWQDLEYHPLSELVEFGSDTAEEIAEHIKEHGYDPDEAVVLYEGRILDGRHRHAGCVLAGVTPTFKAFVGKDPRAYVAKKAFRQHVTVKCRAKMAAKLCSDKLCDSAVTNVTKIKIGPLSLRAAAKLLDVSHESVRRAKRALEGKPTKPPNSLQCPLCKGKGYIQRQQQNELFDAVVEITGADPKVSASHIVKVCKLLLSADPPYTADEIRRLPDEFKKAGWKTVRVTVGMIEKYVGWVRKNAPSGSGLFDGLKEFLAESSR